LGRFDEALKDADVALQLCPTDEKALFRASQALYELNNFQESLSYLQRLVERYPENASAQKELSRTKLRIEEGKHATFNFRQMLDSVDKEITLLDCATYIGPIAIKESKGRGRGVFLTRDVKAGYLLLCEKACAAKHSLDSKSRVSLVINTNTSRITKGEQADVVVQIINQLYQNPSKTHSITSAYSGSYQTVKEIEVDGEPIVDS
jgi:tetratricopeptide (TPR) repeat protein